MNLDRDEMPHGVNALNTRLREPAAFAVFNYLMAVISLAIGSAFILVGGWWIHHLHIDEFMFNRATAQGQVVENRPHYGASRETSYRAIVRFTAAGDRDVTVGDWIALDPPSFRVGQSVPLFYDPADPQHAMIDRGWKNYVPGIPGLMGFLSILGGLERLFQFRILPPGNTRLRSLLRALLLTAVAVTIDWIAFGPGERTFGGGVSFGAVGVGLRPGEFFGRAVFSLIAVILDIFAILMWVLLFRRMLGSGAEPHASAEKDVQ
jgi:Protein of unknown function (DUF3592)